MFETHNQFRSQRVDLVDSKCQNVLQIDMAQLLSYFKTMLKADDIVSRLFAFEVVKQFAETPPKFLDQKNKELAAEVHSRVWPQTVLVLVVPDVNSSSDEDKDDYEDQYDE